MPTPQGEDGSADLSYIEAAASEIGPVLPYEAVVVNKSTVPVGSRPRSSSGCWAGPTSRSCPTPSSSARALPCTTSCKPDRVVVGCDDQAAAIKVASLYHGISAPVIVTDPASAETIKYAANAFLATKLSFINAIAAICEGVGADVNDVVVGMGSDKRIGQDFLRPGPGWGGSCFDGAETCVVRDGARHEADGFDELGELSLDYLEILSWSNGQVIPEFQRALAITERPFAGDMVDIRTKMGRRLSVTADHPMVVRRGDTTIIKPAAELTNEDWLPLSLGAALPDAIGAEHASMIEAIGPSGLAWRDIILRLTDEQMTAARAVDRTVPAQRRWDYRRSRTLRLTEAALLRLPLTGALEHGHRHRHVRRRRSRSAPPRSRCSTCTPRRRCSTSRAATTESSCGGPDSSASSSRRASRDLR